MYATRARQAAARALRRPRPASPSASACPTWTGRWRSPRSALVAFSVFTLGQATTHDVPGSPHYYVDRQAIYGVLGVVGMFAPHPHRLLALPRAAGRHLHLPLRQRRAGLRLRLRRARLAALLRTSLLQFPAIGARQAPARACACRVRHRWRQARLARQRTVRYLCLGLAPAALVFLQPDLGTALVFGAVTLAVMYFGGVRWTHFAVIGAALVALDSAGPRRGARSRDARAARATRSRG